MAYIGKQPVVGNFQVCDAITVVNGQAAYTMQVSSSNVEPENANHMLVSLNGILQKPGSSFTISGATITFASNLATGDVIDFIILLGNVLDIGTPSDGTVTLAKLDTSTARNSPAFSVYLTSNQALSNSTATLIAHATEVFDTDSVFTNTSSNYKFTPAISGKYLLIASLHIDNLTDQDEIASLIYKNGADIGGGTRCFSGQNGDFQIITTAVVESDTDDYFQHYGFQVSGGSLNAKAGAGITYFQGFRLIT